MVWSFYENGGLDLFTAMVSTIRLGVYLGHHGRLSGKSFDSREGVTIASLRKVVEYLNKDASGVVHTVQGLDNKIFRLGKYFSQASIFRIAADPRLFSLVGVDEGNSAYKFDAVVEKLEDFMDFVQESLSKCHTMLQMFGGETFLGCSAASLVLLFVQGDARAAMRHWAILTDYYNEFITSKALLSEGKDSASVFEIVTSVVPIMLLVHQGTKVQELLEVTKLVDDQPFVQSQHDTVI